MKRVTLAKIQGALPRFLLEAKKEDVVIVQHGKPVGVLIGFATEDDWLDYMLENHPAFQARINKARKDLREGRGIRLEDIKR